METDQASQENSDKVTPYEDEPVGGKNGQIRSYECTFCKRGFSNAQALGGHMNIHRKQKSKLRLIPSNNETTHHHHQHQVLDVSTRIAPNYYSFLPKLEAAASRSTTIGIRSSIKWPQESDHQYSTNFWESPHVRAIQELPLFVDKPSSHHDHQQNGISTTRKGGLLSSRHGLPSLELDLELRLGSTDYQDSPATAGTKRFF